MAQQRINAWVAAGRVQAPLDLSCLGLTALPPLPAGLKWLDCGYNALTALPPLPAGLEKLDCLNNALTALPPLPAGLKKLYCYKNPHLRVVPRLPPSLREFTCDDFVTVFGLRESLSYLFENSSVNWQGLVRISHEADRGSCLAAAPTTITLRQAHISLFV